MTFRVGYTVLNLLEAGRDAGYVVAMVLICITTFAVSSMLVNCGLRKAGARADLKHLAEEGKENISV